MNFPLRGSYPALITPFLNGKLDEPAFRKLVNFVIRGGSAGVVPCGSTGEAATLTHQEYQRLIRISLEETRKKAPVIAGVGTNATWKAVEMARNAEALGVDALLVLTPYYNKPTQEGIFQHFGAVARSVRLPIVVYNIPGRTAVNVLPATLARMAKTFRNIVAVKEASGSLDQVTEILNRCPSGFTVLSGDDSLTLPMMAVGARGVISVIANILPRETAKMCSYAINGEIEAARRLHLKMFPLIKALFVETNPIPVKAAAKMKGICSDEVRLPLTVMTSENRKDLSSALRAFND